MHAIVVPEDPVDAPTPADLRAWTKEWPSGPKVPKEFEIIDPRCGLSF